VVVDVTEGSPAQAAGLAAGTRILAIDGSDLTGAADLRARVAAAAPDATIQLRVATGAAEHPVDVALQPVPSVLLPGDPDVPYALVWAVVEERLGAAEAGTPTWVLELTKVAVLLESRQWEEAVRLLRRVRVPADQPSGQGMVEYWQGVALSQLGPEYQTRAHEAFERAAAIEGAHLGGPDGFPVAVLARARLRLLDR